MLCLGILWLCGWVYCGWGVRSIVAEVLGVLCCLVLLGWGIFVVI